LFESGQVNGSIKFREGRLFQGLNLVKKSCHRDKAKSGRTSRRPLLNQLNG
jgi:hypothetical protein